MAKRKRKLKNFDVDIEFTATDTTGDIPEKAFVIFCEHLSRVLSAETLKFAMEMGETNLETISEGLKEV
jgi:hypothetical protein